MTNVYRKIAKALCAEGIMVEAEDVAYVAETGEVPEGVGMDESLPRIIEMLEDAEVL